MDCVDPNTLPTKRVLTLEAARAIGERAMAAAVKKGIHYMVISIVDDGGRLIYLMRQDAAEPAAVDIGIAKARTSAITKKPTKWWSDMLHNGVYSFLSMPNVTPVDGANPIVIDGQVVGAISASGGSGEDDNEVCFAGLSVLQSGKKS